MIVVNCGLFLDMPFNCLGNCECFDQTVPGNETSTKGLGIGLAISMTDLSLVHLYLYLLFPF